MKFGQNMDVDNPNVDLKGQGHRSKVEVTRSKKHDFRSHSTTLQVDLQGWWPWHFRAHEGGISDTRH